MLTSSKIPAWPYTPAPLFFDRITQMIKAKSFSLVSIVSKQTYISLTDQSGGADSNIKHRSGLGYTFGQYSVSTSKCSESVSEHLLV